MKVLLIPNVPVNENDRIVYEFTDATIKAFVREQVLFFDFTDVPDGELIEVKTDLSLNPISSLRKKDGVIHVELTHWVTPEEIDHVFDWIDHTEYEQPEEAEESDEVLNVEYEWKTQEEIDAELAEAERLASIPSEVEQLKAQVQASSVYTDFLEEVIVEMAQAVYAGD